MIIAGLLQKYSGGNLYIYAATNYFKKWVEVVSHREIKKDNVLNFIRVNIIYRFNIPRYIITHNGKQFDNKLIKKICDVLDFNERQSSIYHAGTNDYIETFNNTLCSLVKKVVSKSK